MIIIIIVILIVTVTYERFELDGGQLGLVAHEMLLLRSSKYTPNLPAKIIHIGLGIPRLNIKITLKSKPSEIQNRSTKVGRRPEAT